MVAGRQYNNKLWRITTTPKAYCKSCGVRNYLVMLPWLKPLLIIVLTVVFVRWLGRCLDSCPDCRFYCFLTVVMPVIWGALRERLWTRRGVGGGYHHAARPRQHDISVSHHAQHGGVLRLDRPHQEKAGEWKNSCYNQGRRCFALLELKLFTRAP